MRMFLIISLLFVFTVGSNTDKAHAAVPDHTCAHHQIHQDNTVDVDNESCHSEQDQEHCDDCCCVHSHSMATSPSPLKTILSIHKQNVVSSTENHHSIDVYGLKRPPRL